MYNPYIVVPFIAWFLAQLIKFVISAGKGKIDFKYLYSSGGMPSAHAAVVAALATSALLLNGVKSFEFGVALVLAAIVMYDSFGVRRASGEQAKVLNQLIESLSGDARNHVPHTRLRELLGHEPREVFVGSVLGVTLAVLFNAEKLSAQFGFIASRPGKAEYLVYFVTFASVLLASISAWVLMNWHKNKRLKVMRKLRKTILVKGLSIGAIGLLLSLAQYEAVNHFMAWRLWPILLLLTLVAIDVTIYRHYSKAIPKALTQVAEAERIAKWLPERRKKK